MTPIISAIKAETAHSVSNEIIIFDNNLVT